MRRFTSSIVRFNRKVHQALKPLYRTQYAFFAFAILVPTLSTGFLELYNSKLYSVSQTEKALLSSTSVKKDLIKTTEDAFTYNRREELKVPNGNDPKLQELLLSANKTDSTGKQPYQATLSKDPAKGITFGDAEGNRTFTITPEFGASTGRLDEDSRVVYPSSTTERSIYTFKKNGIKNDIVLTEAPSADPDTNGSKKTYSYSLSLGKDLEARQLPSGDIGIYSSDPSFYGNIQVGDQKSQELIDKARNNGVKNTLVFEIPRPFILDVNKKMNYEDVSFKLEPNQKDQTKPTLTLEVRNLKNQSYPLSIDPTITVTTTADFQTNTGDTGNIDFSTSGQITRGSIGSGALGNAGASSTFTVARLGHGSAAYNGYLYVTGGYHATSDNLCSSPAGNYCSDIQYCTVNSNGTVGACTQQLAAFTNARAYHTTEIHNGYLYIIGGYNGTTSYNDVQYCLINSSTGAVGACTQQSAAFTNARYQHTSLVYNGYLYIIGGVTTVNDNDIQYCPINANGSVGTCTRQTSAFTGGRADHASIVYNGYLYIVGGWTTAAQNDIQYCPINANGSVGTCTQQTSAFTTARYNHATVVSGGYLYIIGGSLNNDIQYCPINANGSVGTCTQQTSAFTTARSYSKSVVYKGYLYIIGGASSGPNLNDIQNIQISSGAKIGPSTQQLSAFTTIRRDHSSVSYGNYLYIIGGRNGTTFYNDIQYCPINSSGSVGTCTQQAGAFTTARAGHTSVASGGYLYIIGGQNTITPNTLCNSTSSNVCSDIQYCPINSNGSVGTCTQQTSAFTGARSEHTSLVYGGYLYIIAGWNDSSNYNDIQYCPINSNGSVGTCTQQNSLFIGSRRSHASVIYGSYIYIAGGYTTTNQNDIQYCPINANGSVGTCIQQTSAYTDARNNLVSVTYNGYLYIIGGSAASNYNDIQYCPINANGSVGTCIQQTSAFTSARWGHTAVIYNGYVYIIGGDSGGSLNDINYIRIGSMGGGAGSHSLQSGAINVRQEHTSVAYNRYLYVIGGDSDGGGNLNDIQYCPINSNGSVGTCTQQTNAFTTARAAHTSVVYNGYIYIIGGWDGASTYYNDIQNCPINSNGSVGTCTQQTNAFTTARRVHTSVVYNGYIYIIGGSSGSNLNDIQYCQLNSNGSVGTCIQQTNAFTTARNGHSSVVYKGYIYIIGGWNGTTLYNDIQYCPINANGSVGTCIQQTNAFTTARRAHTSVVYNGNLYILGGQASVSFINDIQYCPINANGTVGVCNQQLNVFNSQRTRHSSIIYNGYAYIIGGDTGPGADGSIVYVPISSTSQSATFERTIDTGSTANTIGSFVILGTAPCAYNVKYATAGSTNIYGATTTVPFALPGTNIAVTASSARYLRVSISLDDSTCGTTSTITDIVVYYNDIPNAPTLSSPANNATNVNVLPKLILGSSDENPYQKYFRYKIDVCTTSNCSTILRTIDQTSSQTGWQGQSQANGTAYSAGGSIVEYAIHQYQATALTANTQYWWRGYAIDPEGSNTWSAASSISTFTTGSATPAAVNITSGTTITSGSKLSP